MKEETENKGKKKTARAAWSFNSLKSAFFSYLFLSLSLSVYKFSAHSRLHSLISRSFTFLYLTRLGHSFDALTLTHHRLSVHSLVDCQFWREDSVTDRVTDQRVPVPAVPRGPGAVAAVYDEAGGACHCQRSHDGACRGLSLSRSALASRQRRAPCHG